MQTTLVTSYVRDVAVDDFGADDQLCLELDVWSIGAVPGVRGSPLPELDV
jgi:hypothetical protein